MNVEARVINNPPYNLIWTFPRLVNHKGRKISSANRLYKIGYKPILMGIKYDNWYNSLFWSVIGFTDGHHYIKLQKADRVYGPLASDVWEQETSPVTTVQMEHPKMDTTIQDVTHMIFDKLEHKETD